MKQARDSGQALVQVAVIFVVLLIFVGVAIDYGMALSVRRELQNAADAGALAGARELCFGERGSAVAAATDYALANEDQATVSVELRDGDANEDTTNGHIVWVRAEETPNTLLLSLAGINSVQVGAEASAACGVAGGGCGMWPISFPQNVWEGSCGQRIYVWDDDQISVNCETWLCDVNGDGARDTVLTGGDRGFLDMSASIDPEYPGTCPTGGGASLIKALIEDDCAGRVSLPQCIPGKPGVVAAVEVAVSARTGDRVLIPLFDTIGCGVDSADQGYHIVDVGCAQVVGYHKNLTIRMQDPATGEWTETKGKSLEVMVSCEHCGTSCGSTDGSTPGDAGEMVAVSLLN